MKIQKKKGKIKSPALVSPEKDAICSLKQEKIDQEIGSASL